MTPKKQENQKTESFNKKLRFLAEEKIRNKETEKSDILAELSDLEIAVLLEELKVHQVELELQNEELRRTEAELESSRLRYFDLYDNAPVAYLTISEDGQILEANTQASVLLEVERDYLIRQYFSAFIFKEDLSIYYGGRKKLIETFTPLDYEIRMLKKFKGCFWASLELTAVKEFNGQTVFRIIIFDITESKKKVEKERQIFLNLSVDMIAVINKNGYFREVNNAFINSSGYNRAELLSRPAISFIHPDDVCKTMKEIQSLALGKPTVFFTNRFLSKDRYYKWLEWSITTAGDTMYSISRDITQRIQTEENMKTELAKEKELNLLKSRFVSMVSHQFKTPLTVIRSNFELINMYKGMINEPFKDRFNVISERIINETRKLNVLLNDILNLDVISTGKPKMEFMDIDINSLVREAASIVNGIQNDGRVIDLNLDPSVKMIRTDPEILSHALINIMTNAFKFSKCCKNPDLNLTCNDKSINIEIRDYGIGIPAGELKNISDTFYRATNTEGIDGTGLGLNIAREYVELINGSLTIESIEKKFTSVNIILPTTSNL